VEATFRGGEAAWRRDLEMNLNPNVPADNDALSQGKIESAADGTHHIKVNNPGKAIFYISNRKRNKQISSVYFVVKKK